MPTKELCEAIMKSPRTFGKIHKASPMEQRIHAARVKRDQIANSFGEE